MTLQVTKVSKYWKAKYRKDVDSQPFSCAVCGIHMGHAHVYGDLLWFPLASPSEGTLATLKDGFRIVHVSGDDVHMGYRLECGVVKYGPPRTVPYEGGDMVAPVGEALRWKGKVPQVQSSGHS
jgi:hypothetical protein